MDYTYLDYFNYYMKEYINELINTFPETQEPLLANYRVLLEGRDSKNDLYVKCFYTKINNYLTPIAERDPLLFETTGKIFIEGIDLYNIWHNSNATDQTHTAIWKYLQILMIIGRKIIPNHSEIVTILNKVSKGDINIPAKVEQTLLTTTKDDDDNNNSNDSSNVFNLGGIASTIGDVCKLASSFGIGNKSSTGASTDNSNDLNDFDIGGILKTAFEVVSKPEFINTFSQFIPQQEFTAEEQPSTNVHNTTSTEPNTLQTPTTTSATQEQQNTPVTENTQTHNISSITDILNHPALTEFISEANTLVESLNLPNQPSSNMASNMSNLLNQLTNKDQLANITKLASKLGNKYKKDIANINPEQILNLLNNNATNNTTNTNTTESGTPQHNNLSQNLGNMLQNVMKNPQIQQMARTLSTRERLRNKLDKRTADQQNHKS